MTDVPQSVHEQIVEGFDVFGKKSSWLPPRRQDSVKCLGRQLDRFSSASMRERSLPEINPTRG